MTLIEMLIALVLAGIVLAALTTGVLTYLGAANNITYRLNETPEVQVASAYFGGDVQSSHSPSAVQLGFASCPLPTGYSALVSFNWTDPGFPPSSPEQMAATYGYSSQLFGTHREIELNRTACVNGAVSRATTLLTHVDPNHVPQISCFDTSGLRIACSSSSVARVDLAVLLCTANADPAPACLDTSIPATLTGVRRWPS